MFIKYDSHKIVIKYILYKFTLNVKDLFNHSL